MYIRMITITIQIPTLSNATDSYWIKSTKYAIVAKFVIDIYEKNYG